VPQSRLAVHVAPCTPAQLGVAACPCSGDIGEAAYRELAVRAARGLTSQPELLLEPLAHRMAALAAAERFEEAADVRDRAAALAQTLNRQRRTDALRRAGVVRLAVGADAGAEVRNGVLVRTWTGEPGLPLAVGPEPPPPEGPLPCEVADEVGCIAGWLEAEAGRVRLEHCDGGLASVVEPFPSFQPGASLLPAGRR